VRPRRGGSALPPYLEVAIPARARRTTIGLMRCGPSVAVTSSQRATDAIRNTLVRSRRAMSISVDSDGSRSLSASAPEEVSGCRRSVAAAWGSSRPVEPGVFPTRCERFRIIWLAPLACGASRRSRWPLWLGCLASPARDTMARLAFLPNSPTVPMARIIADELGGELDVVLGRKPRAPGQPELAIGAVDEAGRSGAP
jgi:hypothetical protein